MMRWKLAAVTLGRKRTMYARRVVLGRCPSFGGPTAALPPGRAA